MLEKQNLLGLPQDKLKKFFSDLSEKPFRTKQIMQWIYHQGATNPKEAASGTIRADFAESLDENAVHGSDSIENAAIEIAYFFGEDGVYPRTR